MSLLVRAREPVNTAPPADDGVCHLLDEHDQALCFAHVHAGCALDDGVYDYITVRNGQIHCLCGVCERPRCRKCTAIHDALSEAA